MVKSQVLSPDRDDDYDNMMSIQNKNKCNYKTWVCKKKTKMKKKPSFKQYFKRMKFNGMEVSLQMMFKRTTTSIIVMVCSRKNIDYGHYYMHNKSCQYYKTTSVIKCCYCNGYFIYSSLANPD